MKTILVTGGAGFIGSHLCERLAREGHRIISLDNYFTGSRENHVAGVEYRDGHTKDIEALVPESPDIVFHLGEYSRVEQSVLEPDIVYDLNVIGTQGVINFWRKRKCKLVYAGSSTKFGDGGLTIKTSPYALHKAGNTWHTKRIGDRENLQYAIAYFYNVYGPRERSGIYGTLIETFKQMYLSGAPLAVVRPGTQTRNFTHVNDVIEALVRIAERGQGDEYGIGNRQAHAILDVARMFGGDIILLPSRSSNRMSSDLDVSKTETLGWKTSHTLEQYIKEFVEKHKPGQKRAKRVLVFSTTFYPIVGPAEEALISLAKQMSDVEFDIVTTKFISNTDVSGFGMKNVHLHRIGFGFTGDKYLLPLWGVWTGWRLYREHRYLFTWSLMASYAALAGVFLKRITGLPLLITLADQDLERVPAYARLALQFILSDADQVYGIHVQEKHVSQIAPRASLRRSIGEGDAFANQLRYAYAERFTGSNYPDWLRPSP